MFPNAQLSLSEQAPEWTEILIELGIERRCTCPCRCDLPATIDGLLCEPCNVSEHSTPEPAA
jgi:hypothetical protein